MLDGEWTLSGSVSTTGDCFLGMWLALDHPTFAKRFLLCPAAEALRGTVDSISESQGAFSCLERVIMTREAESFPWGVIQQEFLNFNNVFDPPPIPLLLASLPSVKHYCQQSPIGLLALPNRILKIEHPPEIVTVHHPGLFVETGALWLPPIVLGATNRYMCNGINLLLSSDKPGTILPPEDIAHYLEPLKVMLNEIPVLHVESNESKTVPFDSVSLKDTKVEIYDYIRHCTVSGPGLDINTIKRHPTDLSRVQSILDEKIGRWKGKVFLKNREDCPPCSACGFGGFWKYKKV